MDIDGVLTDGSVLLDSEGREYKRILYRDLDALTAMTREGHTLAFVTGEDTSLVQQLRQRLPHRYFYPGCKNKLAAVKEIIKQEEVTQAEVCYVGDALSDVSALEFAGLGVCPQDAVKEAQSCADTVLSVGGGQGVVEELRRLLHAG